MVEINWEQKIDIHHRVYPMLVVNELQLHLGGGNGKILIVTKKYQLFGLYCWHDH